MARRLMRWAVGRCAGRLFTTLVVLFFQSNRILITPSEWSSAVKSSTSAASRSSYKYGTRLARNGLGEFDFITGKTYCLLVLASRFSV